MTDGLLFGQFRSSKSTATSRFGELMLVLLGSLFSSIAPAQDPNDFNSILVFLGMELILEQNAADPSEEGLQIALELLTL